MKLRAKRLLLVGAIVGVLALFVTYLMAHRGAPRALWVCQRSTGLAVSTERDGEIDRRLSAWKRSMPAKDGTTEWIVAQWDSDALQWIKQWIDEDGSGQLLGTYRSVDHGPLADGVWRQVELALDAEATGAKLDAEDSDER